MMNWWLIGVDGFRMDVINLISKHATLPDGQQAPGELYGDGSPYYKARVRGCTNSCRRCTGGVRRSGRRAADSGETPGCQWSRARHLYTDRDRHELDMVFQFEHGTRPRSG